MKVALISSWLLFAAASAYAQPQPPRSDLTAMNDEFDGDTIDPKWTLFHERYGWANMLKTVDVGRSVKGSLHLEPYDSGWVRDKVAPFLFQTVQGDFDMRARVRVRSAGSAIPAGTWSLGGLMARLPNGQDSKKWSPNRENWHFITTGVGLERGVTVTETKGTYNSYSSLKLRPFNPGWVELRLVRVGMTLFTLARADGGKWQVKDRFYRMEPNAHMQVGIIAYTSSDDLPPAGREDPDATNRTVNVEAPVDMLTDVDWIRFARPKVDLVWDWREQVRNHPLADPNLDEATILAALGD